MYDLVVLGGGSGGLRVATEAAKVGAKVALIEKSEHADAGAHSPTLASKALIRAASLVHQIRSAGSFGIRAGTPSVDFAAVMARVRSVAREITTRANDESLGAMGIDVYHGSPAFEAYDTVVVDGKTLVVGQRFVIATGSRPRVPEVPGLADGEYLDTSSIWNLSELPETLVILGGGNVAVEFAQAFSRLGSKVKLLAGSDHVLPAEDPEIAARVEAVLAAGGVTIKTRTELTRVSVKDGQKLVSFRDRVSRDTFEASGSHILVADGRLANVDGLNLEVVAVHADPEHGIEVDEYLQTHSHRILAIGDVIHKNEFTYAAEREAAVAFQNAVLRLPRKMDYSALPWTTFTDPEVATVGLSEEAARAKDPEILVFRAEYSEIDRARIDGRTEGFAKLVATPSGKILGLSIVGESASLVLQEFVLAKQHGLTLSDIASTAHIYPTYAALARKLAQQFTAARGEGKVVQTALRWFRGFKPRGDKAAVKSPEETATAAREVPHGH